MKKIQPGTPTRQSNFELLRVIAMLMIVAHHFSVHGGFSFESNEVPLNRLWTQFLSMGGKLGVNLFVLISGYFLCTNENLKLKKVLKYHSQVLFYSIAVMVVLLLTGWKFSVKQVIVFFFPVTYSAWWFASTYFVMLVLSPFINKGIHALEKRQHGYMLLLMFVLWSVIPTVTKQSVQRNNLLWFVFLYCLGAYIRKYLTVSTGSRKKMFLLAGLTATAIFACVVAFDFLGTKYTVLRKYATYFFDMEKIPLMLLSAFTFLAFQKTKPFYSPRVNFIASATFGVYLAHDHPRMRAILWGTIFKNASYQDSSLLIPYSLLCITIVYAVGTGIECFRALCFGKWFDRLLDRVACQINELLCKWQKKWTS